ncbi:MAG: cold-shock protein, partial [Alphaproteobacteria bacterium]|nr:cold-shock protein [Alphaproteobacteria bacterium]
DKDVFLHVTALEKAGIRHIPDGQLLSYSVYDDRGRQAATDIKFI